MKNFREFLLEKDVSESNLNENDVSVYCTELFNNIYKKIKMNNLDIDNNNRLKRVYLDFAYLVALGDIYKAVSKKDNINEKEFKKIISILSKTSDDDIRSATSLIGGEILDKVFNAKSIHLSL